MAAPGAPAARRRRCSTSTRWPGARFPIWRWMSSSRALLRHHAARRRRERLSCSLTFLLLLAGGAALLHRVLFGRWSAWPLPGLPAALQPAAAVGAAQLSLRARARAAARSPAWSRCAGAARRCASPRARSFALALYFAHLMAFGVYAVLLLGYEAGAAAGGAGGPRGRVARLAVAVAAAAAAARAHGCWPAPAAAGRCSFGQPVAQARSAVQRLRSLSPAVRRRLLRARRRRRWASPMGGAGSRSRRRWLLPLALLGARLSRRCRRDAHGRHRASIAACRWRWRWCCAPAALGSRRGRGSNASSSPPRPRCSLLRLGTVGRELAGERPRIWRASRRARRGPRRQPHRRRVSARRAQRRGDAARPSAGAGGGAARCLRADALRPAVAAADRVAARPIARSPRPPRRTGCGPRSSRARRRSMRRTARRSAHYDYIVFAGVRPFALAAPGGPRRRCSVAPRFAIYPCWRRLDG